VVGWQFDLSTGFVALHALHLSLSFFSVLFSVLASPPVMSFLSCPLRPPRSKQYYVTERRLFVAMCARNSATEVTKPASETLYLLDIKERARIRS
jgi:hypothetical protein